LNWWAEIGIWRSRRRDGSCS